MITWRLSKGGELLGEYDSEAEAVEAREALCGLNQRDDYLICSFRQIEEHDPVRSLCGTPWRLIDEGHG